ncbi:hypothetical protein HHK36_010331 [Tetracentron sinense]|uniref:BZIP domain-containing protein n=1 Tax=Tetracentron sinense TaxID=13715 RepID=A0A834ZE42_TETSI|nr:hypothetical protein HHK36_010331 [Tetracentron sinense]
MVMDDGELDFSNQEVFSSSNLVDHLPSSCSMDTFFDDIFEDTHACTHTHTCNPPGPDLSHTHTCFHAHTKILSTPTEDTVATDDTEESMERKSKKNSVGNREAVRKYREKKKARAASLEEEVVRLRAHNQQLMKRLQGQAALEAEIARLKCLLVDIRGRIEGEIGSFPYQKLAKSGDGVQNLAHTNLSGAYVMNPCDLRCDDQVYCLHSGVEGKGGEDGGLNGQGFNACEIGNLQCVGNPNSELKDLSGCGLGTVVPTVNSSGAKKRKDLKDRMVGCLYYFTTMSYEQCRVYGEAAKRKGEITTASTVPKLKRTAASPWIGAALRDVTVHFISCHLITQYSNAVEACSWEDTTFTDVEDTEWSCCIFGFDMACS